MHELTPARRPRVCFLFIAQQHQVAHAALTAIQLSRRDGVEVHVAAATAAHLSEIRDFEQRLGGGRLIYHRLWPEAPLWRAGRSIPPKALVLGLNLALLRKFDAIVTPERTSLMLRKMGLKRQVFIHVDHGAGDRAVGYEPRISRFDLVLLAGEKQRRRMLEAGLIRGGGYAVVGYPKFDAVDLLATPAPRLFDAGRPTVLYNPHFHAGLGSWERFGRGVLRQFAAQSRYNLIFAPHLRLFDGAPAGVRRELEAFRSGAIHVDLGSPASSDMTYTRAADVYLGDVSSQSYEFIRTPRPCLFLNAHGVDWAEDENYAHWRFGPVLAAATGIVEAVDAARATHPQFEAEQRRAFADTFDLSGDVAGGSAARAASAIFEYLAAHPRRYPGGQTRT